MPRFCGQDNNAGALVFDFLVRRAPFIIDE